MSETNVEKELNECCQKIDKENEYKPPIATASVLPTTTKTTAVETANNLKDLTVATQEEGKEVITTTKKDNEEETSEISSSSTSTSCDNTKKSTENSNSVTITVVEQDNKLLRNIESNGKLPSDLSSSETERSSLSTTTTTKSILSNGTIPNVKRSLSKKSVTFDPDDEIVKKFTEGEIIVDQKNPFKNGILVEPTSIPTTVNGNRKLVLKVRKSPSEKSGKKIDESDFVTTEDVLNESKYVKTYIKNPDKYFTYDPTIIARLKFDELKELRDKKPPKRIRLSTQTQERLKELKNKYTSLSQSSPKKGSASDNSKIPTFKKVSKANYPDLSQIKVKTGTDLETSLFNPDEVTKNAKKFDECVKKLHISSDDDLEEIDEPLTKSDSSEELKPNDQVDSTSAIINGNKDEKKSFTNTVNSVEFQEYLNKKGLTLAPKVKLHLNGGTTTKPIEITTTATKHEKKHQDKLIKKSSSHPQTSIIFEMEPKKVKKPSVFQRLLPTNIFSSKRKTTPKESVPTPQTLYTNTTNTIVTPNVTNDDTKNSSNIKRVVLERQSFHGGAANNTNVSNDLRKQMERSRKSYSGDDRSSSISSALTNAEEFCEMTGQSSESILGKSSSETLGTKTGKSRNSSTVTPTTASKERLQNFQSKSVELRDGIVKPRVQRASLPIGTLKSLSNKSLERNSEKQPVQMRRTLERQSLVQKRPSPMNDDNFGQFGRSSSMDRHEITKRAGNAVRLSSSLNRSSRNSTLSQKSGLTPKNSKENLIENGPKMTSTPIHENANEKSKVTQSPIVKAPLSPITINTAIEPPTDFNVGPEEWAKLREIKEKTDRELFNKIIQQHHQGSKSPIQVRNSENIYEKLSGQQQQLQQQQQSLRLQEQQHQHQQQQQQQPVQILSPNNQPVYAQLIPEAAFIRGSPQRNTFTGVFRNRNVKIVDGNAINMPDKQMIPIEPAIKVNTQPPRSQSVLDEMMIPQHQQQQQQHHLQQQSVYGSVTGTPVIMRRKENASLTREEILQKVKEFCRKSMNKTPTKMGSNNQLHKDSATSTAVIKTASDISPVSYASVDYQGKPTMQKIVAPQVPQRIQSLQMSQASPQTPSTSPIYAHVMKRNSIQSNISDMYDSPQRQPINRTRASTMTSETDSIFLAGSGGGGSSGSGGGSGNQAQPASPARYIVVDSDKLTPAHVMKYRNAIGNEIYGQLLPNSYGYIQLKPPPVPQNRSSRLDGRTTPVTASILERPQSSPVYLNTAAQQQHQIQQQSPRYFHQQQQQQQNHHNQQQQQQQRQTPGNVVYLKVKDQVWRPINPSDRYYHHMPTTAAKPPSGMRPFHLYESESGSEAPEEDWQNDKSGRNQSSEQATDDRRRAARREDPRRHTLGGDMLQYGGGQGQQQQRAMDLEMGTRAQKSKKAPPVRGYTPINQGPLFDEDPGIMSEVETASTGFRRGGKQRSSLPVVRTPSKTLERPLGLVFLQYRSETKRALLPNEITSIDTVRALFVRSFPRQLTMAYLEGPNVKIYIHDASKDMFYELEDVRSHLREIRDRSVLRLFESNEVAAPQVLPGGPGIPQPLPPPTTAPGHWDQDQSYFSEPEFDSEYQHQHIHKSKSGKPAPYYVGGTQTLPRGMYSDRNKNSIGAPVKPLRSYGSRGSMGPPFPYPPDQLYSIPDGYTSSPERGTRGGYEEPYYSQYGTRGTTVAPIIDEEQRCEAALTEDQYALYGMKVSGRIPRNANQMYDPTRPEDLHRIRVEHMERQLANLTGLVQKALNQNPQMPGAINANYLGIPGQCRGGLDDLDGHSSGSSTSIQDKSVSFEKSVSFSDDIQGVPKSHSPQHAADSKPPKPAIKSSTLPRTSSQERDRLKPPPPPKPLALAATHPNYRPDIALAPEVYNHLRGLQKKAKDLRMEVRTLRRLSQAQAVAVREDIKDAFMRIRATLLSSSGTYWGQGDVEKTRISREEELYKQEVIRLEKDLGDLEASVEGLRGEVINRRTRVNMAAVEDMALVLSRASKTVAELKMRFPGLQQGLRNILANEMEKVVREEKFLKDEPDRLESALRRCKKLTGTLVTLKRLASVQEQRLPVNEPINEDPPRSTEISAANKPIPSPRMGSITVSGGIPPENALDALLDELQTFAKPQPQSGDSRPDDSTSDDSSQTLQNTITTQLSQSSLFPTNDPNAPQLNSLLNTLNTSTLPSGLRRLHSYPSGSDTDTSPPQPSRPVGKPPVPERNADLLSKVSNKRIPPPPPPRTSSRSPLASPTSPNIPQRLPSVCENDQVGNGNSSGQEGSGNSSGNESGNDHVQRQLALEMRHQELLKKQKMLQEQYARLQQMSKNSIALPPSDILQLKKTGSESNLPQKMGLSMTVTGSMKNLNSESSSVAEKNEKNLANRNVSMNDNPATGNNSKTAIPTGVATTPAASAAAAAATGGTGNSGQTTATTTTNKVYETDIL